MPAQEEPEAAEPPWLTADQLAAWRGFIRLLRRLPAALEWQLQRDSQLSFIEYSVLAILSDQPGRRMRMSELAVMVDSELSRLSHMVSRLERRGFVCREPDPCNGRYTHAILTDAGYGYLEGAAPGHVRRVRELFIDALGPEELQTLRRISDIVTARIDSVPEQGGPANAALAVRPEQSTPYQAAVRQGDRPSPDLCDRPPAGARRLAQQESPRPVRENRRSYPERTRGGSAPSPIRRRGSRGPGEFPASRIPERRVRRRTLRRE
jgi:DNA-binding MarR family transcriptional regulator